MSGAAVPRSSVAGIRPVSMRRYLPGPLVLLAALMAAAAALTLWETRGQNLYADELTIFSSYRSFDPGVLLRPDGGHLILTSLLAYKTLWAIFGADSYLPIRVLHVVLSLISAGLVYALARRRIGDYAALAPTAVLLLLGSASEITATPFGALAYMGIIFGLAALLAAERGDRRGDVIACLCLIAGLCSYSIVLAFLAGVAVQVFLRGEPARRRSAWIVWVPVALYVVYRLWALRFGGTETNVSLQNIGSMPTAVFTQFAVATAGLSGLFRVPGQQGASFDLAWGYPLSALLAVLAVMRWRRPPPLSPRFWALLATLISFWVLVSLNLGPLRTPEAPRYAYIGGLLLVLIAIELFADWRPRRLGWAALAAGLAASLSANVVALHEAAPQYRVAGQLLGANLAAAEIARDNADPEVPVLALPDLPVVRDLQIPLRDYLASAERLGSPALSPAELLTANSTPRAAADAQLVRLLELHTEPLASPPSGTGPGPEIEGAGDGTATSVGECAAFLPSPGATGSVIVRLPPGGMVLTAAPGPPVSIAVRRFGDSFVSPLASLAGGASARVTIPADQTSVPWRAQIGAGQKVAVCPNPLPGR